MRGVGGGGGFKVKSLKLFSLKWVKESHIIWMVCEGISMLFNYYK